MMVPSHPETPYPTILARGGEVVLGHGLFGGDQDGRRPVADAGSRARRHHASLLEHCRELGQALNLSLWSRVLVSREFFHPLLRFDLDGSDFICEDAFGI